MYETEIANVENYYADLLIIQYRNKPKARATIKLGANLYLADGLVFELNNVLDIDTAVGAQLDLIGKILGVSRDIPGFTIDKEYFSFEKNPLYIDTVADLTALANYDTTGVQAGDCIKVESDSNHDNNTTFYEWVITGGVGAWTYKDSNNEISYGYSYYSNDGTVNHLSQGLWKKYQNSIGSSYSLLDPDYRVLLKFKALYNIRVGSMKFMDRMLYKLFGSDIYITNNQNSSITYHIPANYSIAVQAIKYLGYFDAPLGIKIIYA